MTSAITNVRLFDGESVHAAQTIVINDNVISAVGPTLSSPVPDGATLIDGTGCTLLPGLIDAHTHTNESALRLALQFGVTTELEMSGQWTAARRQAVEEDDTSASLRTATQHMTPPGGHPEQIIRMVAQSFGSDLSDNHDHGTGMSVSTPEEAEKHVASCIESGADYIKVMIEDGHVLGEPNLPMLSEATLRAGVSAAHTHGKMVVAHALTYDSTVQALNAGVDGLAHLFIDRPADDEMIELFKAKNAFVTACACLNASLMNIRSPLLNDERVTSRLPPEWLEALAGTSNTYPQGNFKNVLGSIKALHGAGVDILVGTDSSMPLPKLGGLAHGSAVHHELQLFVEAGLTPVEALKVATSVTAHRFGLDDRGRVAKRSRADLLLVDGDPTMHIQDTLNIKAIWRRGRLLHGTGSS